MENFPAQRRAPWVKFYYRAQFKVLDLMSPYLTFLDSHLSSKNLSLASLFQFPSCCDDPLLNQASILSVHRLVSKEKLSPLWLQIPALGSGYIGRKPFPGGGGSPQAPSFRLGSPSLFH